MTVLKIDIDFKPPKYWMELWKRTRISMLKELGYDVKRIRIYETKRGLHIFIYLEQEIPDDEIINMLQFLCGDDATRVKINQWRIKRGFKDWNKLFSDVIYRKKARVVTCFYCGNKIPIPDK